MELARRSGRPPSRLLMPLALGCLLGGPFTGISTPPNILVTDAVRNAGLSPFGMFDFTPITGAIVVSGIVFMVFVGRHMLPTNRTDDNGSLLGKSYQLNTHLFTTRIEEGSPLSGRTISESRLGSALYMTVLAIKRKGMLMLAPHPEEVLQSGDTLIVHGSRAYFKRNHATSHLQVEQSETLKAELNLSLQAAQASVTDGSPFVGATLADTGLRRKYGLHVLMLSEASGAKVKDMRRHKLKAGDRLLLQGKKEAMEKLAGDNCVAGLELLTLEEEKKYIGDRAEILPLRVPEGSILAGRDLVESRLGNVFGLTVVAIQRDMELIHMPSPNQQIQADDLLILQGSPRDLEIMEGLQELAVKEQSPGLLAELESQQIGVTEVLLSPRNSLVGKSLADLLFREKYGISVLAVWRRGKAHRANLQDMPLQFGDAMLVYGQRRNLEALSRDPDFLVLDQAAAQAPRLEKARLSAIIMVAVISSAILGYVPISIAALTGATLMVLFGCLNMEEAYRAIEWKVVFLIAAMLPLGDAIQNSGAAQMGANALVDAVGGLGPRWVVAALFSVTVLATQIIPTAALVVLMSPVALNASEILGISPHLLMMTVAIAASSSFASPLSHPAHLLVMGPGGYRFIDYMKVGIPITLIALLLSVALLPVFWPPY
jgi:di/tricarboxylate transporter